MKLHEIKPHFEEYRGLTEGRTSKYEAKVDLPGMGVKLVAVYAEDYRAARKMLDAIFGKGKVKSKPVKA